MTRDPHDDTQALKLELSLREANLDVHKAWVHQAETYLNGAKAIADGLTRKEIPEEEIDLSVQISQVLSGLAGAISGFVNTSLLLEIEQGQVEHQRAHLQHHEEQEAQQSRVQSLIQEQTERMAQNLRDAGVDVQTMGGFPGILLRKPPEDDETNG